MQKNYYITLDVKNTASFDEIKAAYRALAKKYHPDKNHGNKASEEYFKEIQQAYAVLSNAEKRKKYDLKFSYTHTYPKQKNASSARPFHFTQQQTKQKPPQPQKKTETSKFDSTESWQILVSVGIALLLLYFIISYNTKNELPRQPVIVETAPSTAVEENEPLASNLTSPYSVFFGEGMNDVEGKNTIVLHNSDESEAVACLVQSKIPNKTIRNQYIGRGTTFKMSNIPDGNYFLKIYFGTNWDEEKPFLNNKIKGGFTNELGFIKMNFGKNLLKLKQKKVGDTVSYSTVDIALNPAQLSQTENLLVEEFFR